MWENNSLSYLCLFLARNLETLDMHLNLYQFIYEHSFRCKEKARYFQKSFTIILLNWGKNFPVPLRYMTSLPMEENMLQKLPGPVSSQACSTYVKFSLRGGGWGGSIFKWKWQLELTVRYCFSLRLCVRVLLEDLNSVASSQFPWYKEGHFLVCEESTISIIFG